MKKEILVAISVAGVLFGLSVSLAAQEKLSLAQCREMAPRTSGRLNNKSTGSPTPHRMITVAW